MSASLVHRGPDDSGLWIAPDGRLGLVNRRLAIRDLSPAGHMPMAAPADNIWITYNGEIYNADELRRQLEALGHSFRSRSDTEVVLRGYEAWGATVVEKLRGMFAFAICDLREQPQVLLARDLLGIKPLYYAVTRDFVVFASELRALKVARLLELDVDERAVLAYLRTGSVPAPLTIYRQVRALEAGSSVLVKGATVSVGAMPPLPEPTDVADERDQIIARTRELLVDAVRSQLVSDVPLGAFLSGGLDSSAVVALMRVAGCEHIRTCSLVFEEEEYSEAGFARSVADAIQTDHYERLLTSSEVAAELPRIVAAMDQPTSDGVNTYFVSQTARQAGLRVALSGLGGDELFGGYANSFKEAPAVARALELAHTVPGGRAAAHAVINRLPSRQRWAGIADALDRPASLASAYVARRSVFAESELQRLVRPELWREGSFDPVAHVTERAGTAGSVFGWISRAELRTYTHHQLLRDTDVMSMAHSLEVRVPLLDSCLVLAVLRLPDRVKRKGAGPKPLLLAAVGDQLPEAVRSRKDKRGFTLPFDRWMKGPLKRTIEDTLLTGSAAARHYFKPGELEALWREYVNGGIHWSRPWSIAALLLWHDIEVGRSP